MVVVEMPGKVRGEERKGEEGRGREEGKRVEGSCGRREEQGGRFGCKNLKNGCNRDRVKVGRKERGKQKGGEKGGRVGRRE